MIIYTFCHVPPPKENIIETSFLSLLLYNNLYQLSENEIDGASLLLLASEETMLRELIPKVGPFLKCRKALRIMVGDKTATILKPESTCDSSLVAGLPKFGACDHTPSPSTSSNQEVNCSIDSTDSDTLDLNNDETVVTANSTSSDQQCITKKKIEDAFQEVSNSFPNIFVLKNSSALCVDCKNVEIQLSARNFLHNAANHIKCDSHMKAAKEKGASTSTRITSFFNPKPKSLQASAGQPPEKKQAI